MLALFPAQSQFFSMLQAEITHQVEKKENIPGTMDHFHGKFYMSM